MEHRSLFEIAEFVLRTRSLFANKSFDEILAMSESGDLTISASVNRSDKWTSDVVKSIEEEVCFQKFPLSHKR